MRKAAISATPTGRLRLFVEQDLFQIVLKKILQVIIGIDTVIERVFAYRSMEGVRRSTTAVRLDRRQ